MSLFYYMLLIGVLANLPCTEQTSVIEFDMFQVTKFTSHLTKYSILLNKTKLMNIRAETVNIQSQDCNVIITSLEIKTKRKFLGKTKDLNMILLLFSSDSYLKSAISFFQIEINKKRSQFILVKNEKIINQKRLIGINEKNSTITLDNKIESENIGQFLYLIIVFSFYSLSILFVLVARVKFRKKRIQAEMEFQQGNH